MKCECRSEKKHCALARAAAVAAVGVWWAGCSRPPGSGAPSALDAPFAQVREYRLGASRGHLIEMEKFIQAHRGEPATMTQVERRLVDLVLSSAPVEARAYGCGQLGLVGGAASVPPLVRLLDDPVLSFHARQALQRIPDPAAGRALREAMGRSQGDRRTGLASSLVARGEIPAPGAAGEAVPRPATASQPKSQPGLVDAGALLQQIAGADPASAGEAAKTLTRLAGAGVDGAILEAAREGPAGVRVRLFGVLAGRGGPEAAAALLEWAGSAPEEEVRAAALDALGKVGGKAEMARMPALFARAGSAAEARAAQDAAWALFRRTGDLKGLKAAIGAATAGAPPDRQDILRKLLAKAEETTKSPGPTADTLEPEPLPTGEGDPIFPDGHHLVAYHDCGMDVLSGGGGGPVIRVAQGKPYRFGDRDPVRSVAFDPKQVMFEISGLRDGAEYVLGLTWWDGDGKGRVQSVHLGSGDPVGWTAVLPAARPVAYYKDAPTWARVLLPVPAGQVRNGSVLVAINREDGPNVVVSELWLLERTPGPARKRVLIVTCDDWKGHLWRQTAPELASILREDPRLEVSINECPWILASPLMDHYDAVVLHFKNYSERLPLGDPVWKGLEKFAASGRGVILAHFGCGAFEDWDGFGAIAGRVWDKTKRGHDPYGPFRVLTKDPGHAITRGMGDFDTADELYTCLKGEAAIRVLCSAISKIDSREHPMAFVVGADQPRVFHCTLGHDVSAFKNEGARKLYRRGAAWACGLKMED